jgi:uncharacterized OsmC-like protein
MNSEELRRLQSPPKTRYRDDPGAAVVTLRARGRIDRDALTCTILEPSTTAPAGLHPAVGGDGSFACSGDMLLAALAACAGVTLAAVSTALSLPISGGTVAAEGEVDFRGTLGVAKDAPVGFREIRLSFVLDGPLADEQLHKLLELTERYCVVFQTLACPPKLTATAVPSATRS